MKNGQIIFTSKLKEINNFVKKKKKKFYIKCINKYLSSFHTFFEIFRNVVIIMFFKY